MKQLLNKKTLGTLCLLGGISISAPLLAGDPVKGQQTAAMCMGCHQPDGNGKSNQGTDSWPRLAGLDAGYIRKQLNDFRAGSRQNPSMMPFAAMLTPEQIADVAAYYAGLPGKATETLTLTPEQSTLGRRLVVRGDWDRYIPSCASCHGPDTSGVGAGFPELAGQNSGYIRQQLKAWQAGTRSNDPNHIMLAVAKRMTDADIDAVALWLANQPVK